MNHLAEWLILVFYTTFAEFAVGYLVVTLSCWCMPSVGTFAVVSMKILFWFNFFVGYGIVVHSRKYGRRW